MNMQWAKLRLSLVAIGLGLAAFAVLAQRLGLGAGDDFDLYRLLALRRIRFLSIGAFLVAAGIGWPLIVRAWRQREHVVLYTLPNALLLIGSVALCLAAFELALRFADGLPLIPDRNFVAERMLVTQRWPVNQYHPVRGWSHHPNTRISPASPHGSLTTGARGVRMNTTRIKPVPKGAILVVGDSFAQGSDVGDVETWPAALERMLKEPVVNAAIGGYGTDQIALTAEELIPAFAPKMLIVSFLDDDIRRSGMSILGGGPKPYFVSENGELSLRNVPVPQKLEVSRHTLSMLDRISGSSYLVEWTMQRLGMAHLRSMSINRPIDNDPTEVSCLLLKRIKALTDRRHMTLLFVMQWGARTIANWRTRPAFIATILQCASQYGVQTLDTWGPLRAVHASDPSRFKSLYLGIDGHMSPAGNEFIADLIAARIRADASAADGKAGPSGSQRQ